MRSAAAWRTVLRGFLVGIGGGWTVFLAFYGAFVLIRLWPTWYFLVPMAVFIAGLMAVPIFGAIRAWRRPLAGSLAIAASAALFGAAFVVCPLAIPGLDDHGYPIRFGFLVIAGAATVVFVGRLVQGPGVGITHTATHLIHSLNTDEPAPGDGGTGGRRRRRRRYEPWDEDGWLAERWWDDGDGWDDDAWPDDGLAEEWPEEPREADVWAASAGWADADGGQGHADGKDRRGRRPMAGNRRESGG